MTRRRAASLVLTVGVALAAEARADAFVTACQSDVQTGAGVNLSQALAAGGLIYVTCPPNSVLKVTKTYTVPANTVLHGNGTAVLDGQGVRGTFLFSAGGKLGLKAITIRNFARRAYRPPEPGYTALVQTTGSVAHAVGTLELEGVTLENNDSPIDGNGTITITRSRFNGNRGLAVAGSGAELRIRDSVFLQNATAVSLRRGSIVRTAFIENSRGAVSISHPSAQAEVRHSEFRGNAGQAALLLSQRAGREGIDRVVIRANTFVDNRAGAVRVYDSVQAAPTPQVRQVLSQFPGATFELAYNRFTRNAGGDGAAIDADLANSRGMRVIAGLFAENVASGTGGAIALKGGALLVTHSIFKGNRGQGADALHAVPAAPLSVANSLLIGHPGAGAVVRAGSGTLVNVTIADNHGVAIAAAPGAALTVSNSILSRNRGGNCQGLPAAALAGRNLQFGAADCPGVSVGDPFLDPLYVPADGSPALTLGDAAVCKAAPVGGRDLVFQLRERAGDCALGAYERPPLRALKKPREAPPRVAVEGRVPEAIDGLVPARAVGPGDARAALLAAMKAEADAPARRVEVVFDRAGAVERHTLDRVGADRIRLLTASGRGTFEAVRVGTRMKWRRDQGPWQDGPAPAPASNDAQISVDRLLDEAATDVSDAGTRPRNGVQERVVSAKVAWVNGSTRSEGVLLTAIDGAGRPSEAVFHGRCGPAVCAFHQRFDFDGISVELP